MKLQFIGIKDDNLPFRVLNKSLLEESLQRLPKGKYRLSVQKYQKDKSNPQLGYYYACVLPMSHKLLLEAGWEFATLDEVDAFWKDLYANTEIINRNSGKVMTIPALKRNMTTVEMMTFVDAIRNHCAEFLGGYIPEPSEQIELEYK